MIDNKIFIFFIYICFAVLLKIKATKVSDDCKIVKDKKTSTYLLSGKCPNGIYYVNSLNGKKATELDFDICAKGSITKYTIISGEMKNVSCATVKEKLIKRRKQKLNTRSGSDDGRNGYKLFKDKLATVLIDDDSPAYLFYCEGDNCTQQSIVGYYVNDKDDVYSCKTSGSEVKCSEVNIETSCTSQTIGKIFYENSSEIKYYVCLDYNGTNAISVELNENGGAYIIGYSDDNIYGLTNNQYAVVEINETSVKLKKISDHENVKYIYADRTNKLKVLSRGETCPSNDDIQEYICENGICLINS